MHFFCENMDSVVMRTQCQKKVSRAGISNYIPQFTVGCNYTPHTTNLLGGILVSLRLSVRPASCVRSVASTVQDGLLTCAPRRSIVLQFFWSARKCL